MINFLFYFASIH